MNIFAIETSCDETSAAVVKDGREVLSSVVASQIDIHAKYGGVVPEVAARAHIENIIPVIDKAKSEANIEWDDIDSLTVVKGAGLLPALLTGVTTAKSLALALDKPLIPVNHIIGHIYANWISKAENEIKFPILALVVSGGHTELHLMKEHFKFERLGSTLDDAAGEAFDKVAKLLGLGYPGGPIVSEKAELGDRKAYDFPRALINEDNFDFSFSGVKTSVINTARKIGELSKQQINDICASFQQAAVDVLVAKTVRAAAEYEAQSVLLGGGVAANKLLRKSMEENLLKANSNIKYYQPEITNCLDNAAMVGVAAYYQDKYAKEKWDWRTIEVDSGLRI